MVKNIFIILLALLLAIATLLMMYNYDLTKNWESYANAIENELTKTSGELGQIKIELGQTKIRLQNTENRLEQKSAEATSLVTQLNSTKAELGSTKGELSTINAELTSLKANYQQLETTAETNKFFFYYVKPVQQYGVDKLASFLSGRQWAKSYSANVFDCSEMSASLERVLENDGFRTKIAIGKSPFGSGRHAWLLVEASPGKYMPVEATTISVVYWNNPYFDNYFKYERSFETIQEALTHLSSDFDWWNP